METPVTFFSIFGGEKYQHRPLPLLRLVLFVPDNQRACERGFITTIANALQTASTVHIFRVSQNVGSIRLSIQNHSKSGQGFTCVSMDMSTCTGNILLDKINDAHQIQSVVQHTWYILAPAREAY